MFLKRKGGKRNRFPDLFGTEDSSDSVRIQGREFGLSWHATVEKLIKVSSVCALSEVPTKVKTLGVAMSQSQNNIKDRSSRVTVKS
jgi:hypothetical protein